MFIFDAHAHIGGGASPEFVTADMLVAEMKRSGITKCCAIGGLPVTKDEMIANNDFVSNAAKKYPKEIPYGIGSVNPRLGDIAVKELRRAVLELSIKGIKFLPPYQGIHIDSEVVRPIYEFCQDHSIPIYIHTDWPDARCNPITCAQVASKYPKNLFILCHTPREPINNASVMMCAQALRMQSNVVLDTAMAFDSEIETIAKEVSEDRICFGTDWPSFRYAFCKAKVSVCDLPDNVKAKIFGLNLAKILGVDVE
ncbi:MAG: amidohydrolase family protein [archaeon]|nr:amidohydrolase family protein [archaeon]